MTGFIFGGNTPWSYDELQKKRTIAEELVRANMSTPRNVGEGLNAIGRALAFRSIDKKASKRDAELKGEFDAKFSSAFGGYGSGGGAFAPPSMGAPAGDNPGLARGTSFAPVAPLAPTTPNPGGLPEEVIGAVDKVAPLPAAPQAKAFDLAAKNIGLNENDQRTALQEYMANGGVNLDPAVAAWCAAYVNASLEQAGIKGTGSNMARSFLEWGQEVDQPSRGDIGVLPRGDINGPYGHVGFVDGVNEDGTIRILGGNQGDAVSVQNYPADAFLGFRRAANGAAQPPQPAGGGMDLGTIAELAGSPYATPGQKAVLAALMQQQMQMMDPMYQMEMQKAQLELAQMQNPEPGFQQLTAEEVASLGLPPGVYQRGPDGRIDTIEKTQGPVDPIADLKARAAAAGLQEGTPEFQQFMLNNGKTPEGMVIESDGQGGFRMVQGAGAGSAAAKPFTEGQSKDVVYATRAQGALEALDPIADSLTDRGDVVAGWLPLGLGGGFQGDDYQVAKTAGDEFLQAILRKDTGAAITADEQVLYGETYLPKPGDSAARLQYKKEARQRAVAAIEAGMSPAQIIAQEKALEKGATPPPAETGGDDGWTTLPSGVKVRVKQ